MEPYFKRQTWIKKFVVSTVGHHTEIGYKRTAETMIFRANAEAPKPTEKFDLGKTWTSAGDEVYFESHGILPTKELLDKAHSDIVEKLAKNKLELYGVEEEV